MIEWCALMHGCQHKGKVGASTSATSPGDRKRMLTCVQGATPPRAPRDMGRKAALGVNAETIAFSVSLLGLRKLLAHSS